MPTDPQQEAARLIGEAHGECQYASTIHPTAYRCAYRWPREGQLCRWYGHAAIDAAILAAVRATRERDADLLQEMIIGVLEQRGSIDADAIRTASLPDWCPKEKA